MCQIEYGWQREDREPTFQEIQEAARLANADYFISRKKKKSDGGQSFLNSMKQEWVNVEYN